ncbi:hypothetical protein Ahy_A06g026821 [Arachis hypogaea]|uniref:Uncharacterized protein n=1 Tax=Arachis hypogaea TaxID=3818 RepID=A0A445CLT7_ARAHY|nr:hypothetical protein Ahy_A06g026821 [Arachis hypogaea]
MWEVISNKEVEKSHNTTMQLSVAVVNLQSQNFTIRDLDKARLRVAKHAIQKTSEKGSNASNEMDVWYEIFRFKKGRIHGLVIKFTVIDKRLSYRGSSSQSSDWLRMLKHKEVMKRMQE